MKTRMKPLLVSASGAIMAALLAFSFTVGSSRSVRAEEGEALATARPDIVLISAKDLEGLEQRVSRLEGIVASLTEASQHVKTQQLCVYDDSGSETCVTKAQLDALLTIQAHRVEAARPIAGAEGTPSEKEQSAAVPPSEPPAGAVPTSNSEPPAPVMPTSNSEPSAAASSNGISPTEPESTGSISTPPTSHAGLAAQPGASPDSEAAKNDEVQGLILMPTAPLTALAAQPSAPPDFEAVETDDLDLD
jgi:hypothetical protein